MDVGQEWVRIRRGRPGYRSRGTLHLLMHTRVGLGSGWHEIGSGSRLLRVGVRVGHGDWRADTLVAPLWRGRCERDIHAPIASLGGGGVTGLRDGLGQAGSSCPVTTRTRTNTDTTVTAALGHHGWPPDKGLSRR